MKRLILIGELLIAFGVSFGVLLWIGSEVYAVIAAIVAAGCALLLVRPKDGLWPGFMLVLFGFSLGIFFPSLPLIIAKGDAKRRRALASVKAAPDGARHAEPGV